MQLTDKLKNQSESNKQAQDNLHEQMQEQKTLLRSAQDRAHTLETSVAELTTQLADSKEKLAQVDTQVDRFAYVMTSICDFVWGECQIWKYEVPHDGCIWVTCRSRQMCSDE